MQRLWFIFCHFLCSLFIHSVYQKNVDVIFFIMRAINNNNNDEVKERKKRLLIWSEVKMLWCVVIIKSTTPIHTVMLGAHTQWDREIQSQAPNKYHRFLIWKRATIDKQFVSWFYRMKWNDAIVLFIRGLAQSTNISCRFSFSVSVVWLVSLVCPPLNERPLLLNKFVSPLNDIRTPTEIWICKLFKTRWWDLMGYWMHCDLFV